MAIEKNYYPPVLDTYMPAFPVKVENNKEKAEIKIYFSISAYNSYSQIKDNVQVRVQNQYTNDNMLLGKYITNGIKVTQPSIDETRTGEDKYYVTLTQKDFWNEDKESDEKEKAKKFALNQYMKVQIRFSVSGNATKVLYSDENQPNNQWFNDNVENFTEWSKVCLIRPISKPHLYIQQLNQDSLTGVASSTFYVNDLTDLTGHLYFEDDKEQEKLESYRIKLFIDDKNEELIIDSGLIYANESTPNYFNYTFNYQLRGDVDYRVNFEYTTITKFNESKDFYIKLIEGGGTTLKAKITTTPQNDLGRMKINVKHNDNIVSGFIGIINFRRTSSESNYTIWEDVHRVYISDGTPLDYTWYDYTTKSGVFYRYGVQRIDDLGRRGVLLRETKLVDGDDILVSSLNDLEDIFIVRDGKMLCLKYNSSVDSLTPNILSAVSQTLGSKYPFITRNGIMDYKTFSLNALISCQSDDYDLVEMDEEGHNNFDYINFFTSKEKMYGNEVSKEYEDYNMLNNINKQNDFAYERDFREAVIDFLKEDNVKLFRSAPEGNLLVKFSDISLTPETGIGRLVYNLSATVTEVDDYSLNNIDKYSIQPIGNIKRDTSTIDFIGQIIGRFKPDKVENNGIVTYISDPVTDEINAKHMYSTSLDTYNSFINFNWLRIRFYNPESDAVNVYVNSDGVPVLKQPDINATVRDKGFIIRINDKKDIFISAKNPVYEISDFNTPIKKIQFISLSGTSNTIAPYVCIDYIATFEKKIKEKAIVERITSYKGIAQIRKDFEYNERVYPEWVNKHSSSTSKYYNNLLSIDRVSIEAEPGTILYVKDSADNEKYYEHRIWDTGKIDFYSPQYVVLDIKFGGRFFSNLLYDNNYYNFLSEIENPVEYKVYKITKKHLEGNDTLNLSQIMSAISSKNLARLNPSAMSPHNKHGDFILTTDTHYEPYIFIGKKFYPLEEGEEAGTGIAQIPVHAYINYTYESERGKYKIDS